MSTVVLQDFLLLVILTSSVILRGHLVRKHTHTHTHTTAVIIPMKVLFIQHSARFSFVRRSNFDIQKKISYLKMHGRYFFWWGKNELNFYAVRWKRIFSFFMFLLFSFFFFSFFFFSFLFEKLGNFFLHKTEVYALQINENESTTWIELI